jgi:signal peptidase II
VTEQTNDSVAEPPESPAEPPVSWLSRLPDLLLIVAAFAADRLAKLWAAAYLAQHGPTRLAPFVDLVETYNRGIAFGLFQGIGPWVGWLTVAVLAAMFIVLMQLPRSDWLERAGLALILCAPPGNLVDRVRFGQVLDFIETPFRPGIFNVADALINVGVVLVLAGAVWHAIKSRRAGPAAAG